jgi:hypothetical protein
MGWTLDFYFLEATPKYAPESPPGLGDSGRITAHLEVSHFDV